LQQLGKTDKSSAFLCFLFIDVKRGQMFQAKAEAESQKTF